MTSIARENNVSVNTVQRVLGSCSHQFSSSYDYLPEHLAFDEFKGVDRTLHFICLDADKHEVVQIPRTRYKKAIIAYCKKFAPAALQGVKTVSLDLNFYYQDILPKRWDCDWSLSHGTNVYALPQLSARPGHEEIQKDQQRIQTA